MSGHDIIIADLRRQLDRMREERDEALSGEADAVRRAEAAELGCEIAYRREPTQAEGDAHEYRHDQSMGASETIGECHVPMGNHHGHRCLCGRWVWGGPTACDACAAFEAGKERAVSAEAERDEARADLALLRARLPSEEDLRVLRGVEWPPMTALDRNMIEDWLARQEDSDD